MVHPSHGFTCCCWDDDSIGCRSSRIPKRRDNETVLCWKSKVMKSALAVILILLPIQAIAETEDQNLVRTPTTYKECIQRASDINSKWIEYRDDVNKCRAKFDVYGEYWLMEDLLYWCCSSGGDALRIHVCGFTFFLEWCWPQGWEYCSSEVEIPFGIYSSDPAALWVLFLSAGYWSVH